MWNVVVGGVIAAAAGALTTLLAAVFQRGQHERELVAERERQRRADRAATYVAMIGILARQLRLVRVTLPTFQFGTEPEPAPEMLPEAELWAVEARIRLHGSNEVLALLEEWLADIALFFGGVGYIRDMESRVGMLGVGENVMETRRQVETRREKLGDGYRAIVDATRREVGSANNDR